MSTRPPISIAERLNAAELAIANTLAEAEIQTLVAAYGYSSAELGEGTKLVEAARAASADQTAAEGAQLQSHAQLTLAQAAAHEAYQALAKVSRAVFQSDKSRLAALGLNGQEPASTAGFLDAASVLFENAVDAPKLAGRGYDAAQLEAERAKIEAFKLADQKHRAAIGAAQQATIERDAAMEQLDAWRAQFFKIAKVALHGKRQLLEKLGVAARTSKTAAQRAAKKRGRMPKPTIAA